MAQNASIAIAQNPPRNEEKNEQRQGIKRKEDQMQQSNNQRYDTMTEERTIECRKIHLKGQELMNPKKMNT